MLIIGRLERLYKSQPKLIDNMYLYKILKYNKPPRLHTDKWEMKSHQVVKCLTDVEFVYDDTEHFIEAGNYILFDCQILHGNKSYTKYKKKQNMNYICIITHKLLDNL